MSLAVRDLLRDVALAVTFFTRLPIPVPTSGQSVRPFGESLWAAPLAGWLVGLSGAAGLWLAAGLGLPAGPAAAMAMALTVVVSGALHEDGLSDTADGFGGGRDRARKLEIMRDSRIGSYGAAALGLSLLLRWSALAALVPSGWAAGVLIAVHGAARAMLPLFLNRVPPARTDGLSAGAGSTSGAAASTAVIVGLVPLVPLLGLAGALAAIVVLGLTFMLLAALCRRQIGGQTGDTAGALEQASEIVLLLAALSILP